jgi:putative protease
VAAIDCGADAVYIGAPRFGAREAAGNSLDDIATLAAHAHRYWARVYVALNTLLRDDELPKALALIRELHKIGIDGLIIQDVGLLELDLPPLPLIASTQMHNAAPARVAFLEQVGFQRAILARELDLEGIRAIRAAAPRIELECFIHGALCVCYSGQCSLSYALGGRSGNRGQCAQPCRKPYALRDGADRSGGRVVPAPPHLLSLRDLNLSDHLDALLDAGVASFKIEGRLKDLAYVVNTVAHYRAKLDAALAARRWPRAASGRSSVDFVPDPDKTFNRGFTTYFLNGRGGAPGAPETPKMLGEPAGEIAAMGKDTITFARRAELVPGDGLCFFDRAGELRGTAVNAVQGRTVTPAKMEGLERGQIIYRNHDHAFLTAVRKSRRERRIGVALTLTAAPGGLTLAALDEDGVRAGCALECAVACAEKPDAARATIERQLRKTGESIFECREVTVALDPPPFVPVAVLNALRRGALEQLSAARELARPRPAGGPRRNDAPYPEPDLSYLGNALNGKAEAFYRRHGVLRIEPAAETGLDLHGRRVMRTRYCVREQLGLCPKHNPAAGPAAPLTMIDEEGRKLELRFVCGPCEMEVYLAG